MWLGNTGWKRVREVIVALCEEGKAVVEKEKEEVEGGAAV